MRASRRRVKRFLPLILLFAAFFSWFEYLLQIKTLSNAAGSENLSHVRLKRASDNLYIFEASSQFDSNEVTVLTATERGSPAQTCFFCLFLPKSTSSCSFTSQASATEVDPFMQNLKMISKKFECRLPNDLLSMAGITSWEQVWMSYNVNVTLRPTTESVTVAQLPSSTFTTIIHNTKPRRRGEITVCSGPYWFYYKDPVEHVMEWIEYQLLMGANVVRFYITKDLSEHYTNVLTTYATKMVGESGKVEVVFWDHLRDDEMHYRSQIALYQHCAMTSKTEWFRVMDVDEFAFSTENDVSRHENGTSLNQFKVKPWRESVLGKYFTDESLAAFRLKTWFHDSTCLKNLTQDDVEKNRFRVDRAWLRHEKHYSSGREKYFARADKVRVFLIHNIAGRYIDIDPKEAHLVHLTTYWPTKNCQLGQPGEVVVTEHASMKLVGPELRKRIDERLIQLNLISKV